MPSILRISDRPEVWGRRLRALRKQQGLSLRKFSTMTDEWHSSLVKIERGESVFSVPYLVRSCIALRITPSEFFEWD
jgi:transcriptional regulator with XRE-family HTH domain